MHRIQSKVSIVCNRYTQSYAIKRYKDAVQQVHLSLVVSDDKSTAGNIPRCLIPFCDRILPEHIKIELKPLKIIMNAFFFVINKSKTRCGPPSFEKLSLLACIFIQKLKHKFETNLRSFFLFLCRGILWKSVTIVCIIIHFVRFDGNLSLSKHPILRLLDLYAGNQITPRLYHLYCT